MNKKNYLLDLNNSKKPFIIYKSDKGFDLYTDFSKKIILNNNNIERFINNNSKSNKLQDQIFWYKAEPHGSFRLGSKEFWEISKEINSDDDEDVYDPGSQKTRRGPKINVKKSRW